MGNLIDKPYGEKLRRGLPIDPNDLVEPVADQKGKKVSVAIIDPRNLDRECLVRTMSSSYPDIQATGYNAVDTWRRAEEGSLPHAVLYRIGRHPSTRAQVTEELGSLVKEVSPVPVIVIGDSEDIRDMIEVFNCGARGYVPSSVGLDAIVEATRLSFASGVFLPITSLQALRDAFVGPARQDAEHLGRFTGRQLAVCEALRRGKSNKTIAYELNLCESTVKVHIRTIMKKLSAANRTEAAFKLNAVCFGDGG